MICPPFLVEYQIFSLKHVILPLFMPCNPRKVTCSVRVDSFKLVSDPNICIVLFHPAYSALLDGTNDLATGLEQWSSTIAANDSESHLGTTSPSISNWYPLVLIPLLMDSMFRFLYIPF